MSAIYSLIYMERSRPENEDAKAAINGPFHFSDKHSAIEQLFKYAYAKVKSEFEGMFAELANDGAFEHFTDPCCLAQPPANLSEAVMIEVIDWYFSELQSDGEKDAFYEVSPVQLTQPTANASTPVHARSNDSWSIFNIDFNLLDQKHQRWYLTELLKKLIDSSALDADGEITDNLDVISDYRYQPICGAYADEVESLLALAESGQLSESGLNRLNDLVVDNEQHIYFYIQKARKALQFTPVIQRECCNEKLSLSILTEDDDHCANATLTDIWNTSQSVSVAINLNPDYFDEAFFKPEYLPRIFSGLVEHEAISSVSINIANEEWDSARLS
jgi:hypothetical protein